MLHKTLPERETQNGHEETKNPQMNGGNSFTEAPDYIPLDQQREHLLQV